MFCDFWTCVIDFTTDIMDSNLFYRSFILSYFKVNLCLNLILFLMSTQCTHVYIGFPICCPRRPCGSAWALFCLTRLCFYSCVVVLNGFSVNREPSPFLLHFLESVFLTVITCFFPISALESSANLPQL